MEIVEKMLHGTKQELYNRKAISQL